jgi:serine/threonine-protein kinase
MKPEVVERIGNYRIDGERRRDATSIVYEARHLVLPRRAFIKVMNEADVRPAAIQLLREACILEALEHPGIIRVFESGLLPDRKPWFAYERVEGATVGDLWPSGPLDPPHAAALLRDIADILEHAHRRGVVHCSLRPDRIVVTGRARGFPLCIADWADARVHDTSAPVRAAGSIEYSAPELVKGDMIDDRVDIFSLGVIAYQALTGNLPTASDLRSHQVLTEVHCPDAPPPLTGLVDQMLAWDRFDRPSSAEVKAELTQLAADLAEPESRAPGVVRIRKPRWTPSLSFDSGEPDIVAIDTSDATDASGEKPT